MGIRDDPFWPCFGGSSTGIHAIESTEPGGSTFENRTISHVAPENEGWLTFYKLLQLNTSFINLEAEALVWFRKVTTWSRLLGGWIAVLREAFSFLDSYRSLCQTKTVHKRSLPPSEWQDKNFEWLPEIASLQSSIQSSIEWWFVNRTSQRSGFILQTSWWM